MKLALILAFLLLPTLAQASDSYHARMCWHQTRTCFVWAYGRRGPPAEIRSIPAMWPILYSGRRG